MLVEFYKGPASGYNAGSHSNGIYQCTDTGDTYIFGVLNKGGKGIRVLDFATDFKGGSGNMDEDLYNTLKQELSDGVPMFIKMTVGENPIMYPLIVSKSRALASPNPEVLDFQIAINSIMGDNEDRDGGGISVMANFLEVRGDTFEISVSAQSLLLLTEEKDYFRVLANNGQYVDAFLYIGSIPKQAYNVIKEVVASKNLTSETWGTFKTYVDTGIRSNAYWDYYFTGTSFGTFRYNYTENTATITTYSLVDESLENPGEQLSKQYSTIYSISSDGIATSITNVPKLQYDESGVIVGAGNGTEEKSITLLTGGDGSKVLADNGSYISSQDSRVYVWEIPKTEIDYEDIQYNSSFLSKYSTEGLKGTFNITEDIYNSINNSQIIIIKLTSSTDNSNYKYDIVQKSTSLRSSGAEEEPILTLDLVGFSNLISGSSYGYFRNELTILIPTVSNGDSTYSVSWNYTSSNVSRFNIFLSSLISLNNSNISASSNGISPEEYSKIEYSYQSASSINLLSVSYYGGLSKVVSNIARDNYPEQGKITYYLGILLYPISFSSTIDNYPKLVRVSVSPDVNGGDDPIFKDYHPVTIESIVDLKTLSVIKTDGEGNQFLSDNGTYKTVSIEDEVYELDLTPYAEQLSSVNSILTIDDIDSEKINKIRNAKILRVKYPCTGDGGVVTNVSVAEHIIKSEDDIYTYYFIVNASNSGESRNSNVAIGNKSTVLYTISVTSNRIIVTKNYNNAEITSWSNFIYPSLTEYRKSIIESSLTKSNVPIIADGNSQGSSGFTFVSSGVIQNAEQVVYRTLSNESRPSIDELIANISDGSIVSSKQYFLDSFINSVKVGENADSLVPESGVVTLPAATTEADGIMSKTDKTSLDSLSGLGFVLLSEEETNELLNNNSSTAISEPLYTKLSDPNTHLVIFTNVSKEGGLDGGSSETERIYYILEKRVIATGNTISLIYSNSYGTSGTTGNISYSTYDIDTDKIVTRSNFHLTFELMGDGDKFLSDDGTYKVIEVPTEATQISLSNSYVPSDLENESLIPAAGDTVETVIGKLHKATLDNEEVVASAFAKLNSSCGFNNNGEYVPVGSITTGTNSLGGAISKLDTSISSIKSFRDITVGDSTLTPGSSSDTLTLTQGEGITLTPGGDNKSLTISASDLVSRVTAVESELQGVNALADELLTLTE